MNYCTLFFVTTFGGDNVGDANTDDGDDDGDDDGIGLDKAWFAWSDCKVGIDLAALDAN